MLEHRAVLFFSFLKSSSALIIFCLLLFISSSSSSENPEKMMFYVVPPLTPVEIFGNSSTIYADGIIDADAPARLLRIIDQEHIKNNSQIYFNSSGGNLIAGMELGRIIRNKHFNSYIGKRSGRINYPFSGAPKFGGEYFTSSPGICFSACALSFLGGSFRYLSGGQYGVHRFFGTKAGELDGDIAQIVSAKIVQFIRDMGVDEKLFTYMSIVGKSQMIILNESELTEIKVINNGIEKAQWSIESVDFGLYLKGQQETVWGSQKITFSCNKEKI